ncbi:(11Z)-hexadec-11-enoyl-CoA conjugase-like [Sipha flava]|uniref:(11Z)-hexadec-11-enoyl-CoA conjugase-like n=3 Tax=Sipha flava TaxID=143950 RepID=A0A8B8FSU4_9HEMI|nr:(11Z)-hexadec-11-enoyl-CoA conjugase-like [Sipha flava]XP_025413553.1 (11Z)-hexadec-11-enoyl-CoA conjugase-like [Sipha flava]
MSPNATDSSTILREERKIPNGCTNGWPSMSDSTEKQCWKGQAFLKINEIVALVKHYSLRAYIIFWHELSMNPRVRSSPFSPPPADELVLSKSDVFSTRRRRLFFLSIHLLALAGLYLCVTGQVKLYTVMFAMAWGTMSSIGVTAGAHRLWSHHAYKAKWPLRVLMALSQTVGVQYSVYNWVRDHRLHHKYTDTDADPHNSNRGFFYSHVGWALIMPHPAFESKVNTVDMADMEADWVVMWQYRLYAPLAFLLSYALPTVLPWWLWGEDLLVAHLVAAQLRHVLTLHSTFLINSAAHMWGLRPYDKNINPTENMLVSVATCGDGWHNYHHTFPWDYKNAELLDYKLNLSTLVIDMFSLIGWAYDLKTVPAELVNKRALRTGDGTRKNTGAGDASTTSPPPPPTNVYGWTDNDLPEEDRQMAQIYKKSD